MRRLLAMGVPRSMGMLLALVPLVAAGPLSAQDGIPWRASYFPYPIGNPTTGLMGVAHYHLAQQADYDERVPFRGIFSADAGWSTNNSRFASLRFRAPLLVPGWRFAVDAGAGREAKFGYYGSGPDGSNEALAGDNSYQGDFFRVSRTRYQARLEVTRHVAGPFSLSVGAGATRFRYSSAPGGSLFAGDYFQEPLTGTDATARVSTIFDTRDNEYLPSKGVLLEAGAYLGTGKFEFRFLPPAPPGGAPVRSFPNKGYGAGYLNLRGYVSPRAGTVLAGRFAVQDMGDGAPLDARYTLPGWERDVTVMGGADSHRSFIAGRFAGRGLLLGNLEVRHNLLDLGDYGGVTLLAFMDAGRVFGSENFRWTLSGWKVGGGAGMGVRILRSALLVMNFAGGPDGFAFSMSNGFAF